MADQEPVNTGQPPLDHARFRSGVPLHTQIHDLMRQEILDGLFIGKDAFPGEVELAERFGVSVITSRAVLKRLQADGLVERSRGRRARAIFVPDYNQNVPTTSTDGALEKFDYNIVRVGETTAPWQACRHFGLEPGSVLWECVRLRSLNGKPHSVTMSFQPVELGRQHDPSDVPHVQMPVLLASTGNPVLTIARTVGVARPSAEIGAALGVTVWERLLLVTVSQYSTGNRPIEWTRFFYHPAQVMPLETIVRTPI